MPAISFLPDNDATNGWNRILPQRGPNPALQGRQRADWIVVGAGFAGLAAARRLAENRPSDSIALIEAHEVAENASGRNSGFAIDVPHNTSGSLIELEASQRYLRLSRAAIDHLHRQVTDHKIDCQWSRRGKYHAAVSAKGSAEILEPFVKELDALGEPMRWLDGAAIERELGSSYYHSAVYTPGCVLLNPAALTRGLAGSLPVNVTLYEHSPVVVTSYGNEIELATPEGFMRAPRMILCVNGFAPEFGFFRDRLLRFSAYASLTRPLTERERELLGKPEEWGLTPANAFVSTTMRYTQDNRILIRHHIFYAPRHGVTDKNLAKARKSHRRAFLKRFPMLRDVDFDYTWAGYVCLSRNYAPGFGRVATNIWTAVCQNAVGVTKGTIAGVLAADMACGEDNPLISDMEALGKPEKLPPRWLRSFGVRLKTRFDLWRYRYEI
ncbi:MAG TPA: FAD-binding oxidoreductase [Hyphomicrobiaceae bacterium]|jgi:glycine/D-amino acid oxidase-like deaminating enzyme|nr:FAD-binding oxidoreductase [Hyphomicrobiaceae bacterium]